MAMAFVQDLYLYWFHDGSKWAAVEHAGVMG